MATTRQFAFRLSDDQIKLLDRRAERLSASTGLQITRSDALRLLLEFAGKVERLRSSRLGDYRKLLKELPPASPERARAQAAHDDWLTMSEERLLGLAELQAAATWATGRLQDGSVRSGRSRMTEEEIDAEIALARAERKGRPRS